MWGQPSVMDQFVVGAHLPSATGNPFVGLYTWLGQRGGGPEQMQAGVCRVLWCCFSAAHQMQAPALRLSSIAAGSHWEPPGTL